VLQWHKKTVPAGHLEATQMVTSYFDPATNYLLLEQWLGLLVAMRVITSSSSGDQIQTRRQQVGLDLYLLI
jgi:hypothetical protein